MFRQPRIVSKRYTDAAKGQPCIKCGRQDGTVVAAHYSGLYASRLGKGGAVKAHDHCTAHLCGVCHSYMDSYAEGNTDGRAVEFLLLILETQTRCIQEGVWKLP